MPDATSPLPDLLAEFVGTYLPARNMAPLTRKTYGELVGRLVAWLGEHGIMTPCQVELRTLNAYLAHLDGQRLAGSTRRKYVYGIKLFFRFLEAHGHAAGNVTTCLIPPALESKEPRVLTMAEYIGLREVVRDQTRDAAIVEVLLQRHSARRTGPPQAGRHLCSQEDRRRGR